MAQKGGPCYRGQARLSTTSQALRASSPSRGASGETVHFAGTAKASPTRSNGDDRRQWRKQGGAVGAAASRMRAAAKQTLGAATRAVARKRLRGLHRQTPQRRRDEPISIPAPRRAA